MADLGSRLFGVDMPSPLILASGPLSYGAEGLWAAWQKGAGGVTTKTLRLEPAVNPTPHLALSRSGLRGNLYNTEKWADVPWEQWVNVELPATRGHPGLLIASVGGADPAEAGLIAAQVSATGVVDAIECVAYESWLFVALIRAVRAQTNLPILAKLSFQWGERLADIAEAALKAGANGFTAIDSIGPALEIDVNTLHPRISGTSNRAWMSGPAIRPIAQAIVADLVTHFGVPVIGTGGISLAEDAVEMTMLGASTLGVCTAPLLHGLEWFAKTNARLSAWLDEHGYASLAELRGAALPYLEQSEHTAPLEFDFEPARCTLCRLCVTLCPYSARQMGGDKPRDPTLRQILDVQRCRNCGLCVQVCKPLALGYANWPHQTRGQ